MKSNEAKVDYLKCISNICTLIPELRE